MYRKFIIFFCLLTFSVNSKNSFDFHKKGVIFYSSFDDEKVEADYSNGKGKPYYFENVKFVEGKYGKGVKIQQGDKYTRSSLVYHGIGNIYGLQGTISVWVKPEWDMKNPDLTKYHDLTGPCLISISSGDRKYGYKFLIIGMVKGQTFRFWMMDKSLAYIKSGLYVFQGL